nr:vegetative cell wall protein gp1-like [Paramormyrops kingsleyae]
MDIPLPNPSLTTATPLGCTHPQADGPRACRTPEPPSDLRLFTFSSPPDLSGPAVQRRQPEAATPTPQPQPAPLLPVSVPHAPLPSLPTPEPAIAAPLTSPAPSQADSPSNLPGLKTWSRTMERRRRKAAEALASSQGLPIPPRMTHQHCTCKQRLEFEHRRFKNKISCEKAEGKSFEEWKVQQEEPH